jgi:ABC-2 type transport system ATP-binding protein
MIIADQLSKVYGQTAVLDIPYLSLEKGVSVGIVGNNGAGKTTLFRLLLDLIAPSEGKVTINGHHVYHSEEWKSITGAFIDESFLLDYLTPEEYFQFIGKLHGFNAIEAIEKAEIYEPFFKGEVLGNSKLIRDLSKGNQKKVGIVGALLFNPELVILDEPFANLDPSTQYQLRTFLKEIDQRTEITLLISSHDLVHVTEFCQRIIVLQKGSIVKDIMTNPSTLSELEDFFMSDGMRQ